MDLYLKDPITGLPSVSLTCFMSGMWIATFKLLISGLVIGGIQFGQFGGTDFAAVVGALGAVYSVRRMKGKEKEKGSDA